MSEKRTGCEEIRASLPELLYGEMDRDEERRVRDHLGDCPQCRRALEDYEKLRSVLRASPPIELPAGLEARVMSEARSAARERAPEQAPEAADAPGGREGAGLAGWLRGLLAPRVLRPAMGAALTILLVLGVAWVLRHRGQGPVDRYLDGPETGMSTGPEAPPAPPAERAGAPTGETPETDETPASAVDVVREEMEKAAEEAVATGEAAAGERQEADEGVEGIEIAQPFDQPDNAKSEEKLEQGGEGSATGLAASETAKDGPGYVEAEISGADEDIDDTIASFSTGTKTAATGKGAGGLLEAGDEAGTAGPLGGAKGSVGLDGATGWKADVPASGSGGSAVSKAPKATTVEEAPAPAPTPAPSSEPAAGAVPAPPAKEAPPPAAWSTPSEPAGAYEASASEFEDDALTAPVLAADMEESVSDDEKSADKPKKSKAKGKGKKKGKKGSKKAGASKAPAADASESIAPQSPEVAAPLDLFDIAMARKKSKDWKGAVTLLTKLKNNPSLTGEDPARVWHELARCTAETGNTKKALVHYENLFARYPSYGGRHRAMWEAANLYLSIGDEKGARVLLEKLLDVPAWKKKAKKKLEDIGD